MDDSSRIRLSKFLSLVLRHRPERIGIQLDSGGWIHVDALLDACAASGRHIHRSELDAVVAACEKQRFVIDAGRIRASQGHSVTVALDYDKVEPPEFLFHGTTDARVAGIRREGLRKMKRHHVHLSERHEVAVQVGGRRGKPCVLRVRSGLMWAAGYAFFRSANGVWLTNAVPPEFLEESRF